MRTWLLLDCHNLAWRAFHSVGDLEQGVVFGFLKDLQVLLQTLAPGRPVFCFDYGKSLRYDHIPQYKSSRKKQLLKLTAREKAMREDASKQIELLRTSILSALGFRNVCFQKRYEADDVIASLCLALPKREQAVIVSSDKDLYQLLAHNVRIYNAHASRYVTADTFRAEYGIAPSQWADVKALAGCRTDDIPGIDGIGDKTAAKFLAGRLKSSSVAYGKIIRNNQKWRSNLPLVQLPMDGVIPIELQRDVVTADRWATVARGLDMPSLIEQKPKGISNGKE